MITPPGNRLAMFVDGASMFYAQRENGWFIDWAKVYRYFTANRGVSGVYYFSATPPANKPERVSAYRQFKRFLQFTGYRVIDKEVRVFQDPSGQMKLKGNLDIELVFRMLAALNSYDDMVLLGGDSDYIPVIEHLRNLGKTVWIVGRRASTSLDLINVASKFTDLGDIRRDIERTDRTPVGSRQHE